MNLIFFTQTNSRFQFHLFFCFSIFVSCVWLQEFHKLKQEMFVTEKKLLRQFGFILHVDHPHKFVLSYLSVLDLPLELKQKAWSLANDRYNPRETSFFHFFSQTIA